jgi:hypothetical protein
VYDDGLKPLRLLSDEILLMSMKIVTVKVEHVFERGKGVCKGCIKSAVSTFTGPFAHLATHASRKKWTNLRCCHVIEQDLRTSNPHNILGLYPSRRLEYPNQTFLGDHVAPWAVTNITPQGQRIACLLVGSSKSTALNSISEMN